MILHFPSLDTLRLALTSGMIPESVLLSAARFACDGDKSLWVKIERPLAEVVQEPLRRLGVGFPLESPLSPFHAVQHWLQIFPLERQARSDLVVDKVAVLFELEGHDSLSLIAMEILRLGNDRQSFRWLGDEAERKALLRVIGPPFYTLLRAIDREGQQGAPVAYREVAPGVWVQVGYSHPFAELLRPPSGQILLMRAPRVWSFVPDLPWCDIYDVIEFKVPNAWTSWNDVGLSEKIQVKVKLAQSGGTEPAEFWVLDEGGVAQLEEFVCSSDNALLARLAFAVGERAGARLVVLRVRPSKSPPPVLVLSGVALRSYLRIPNLFLPIGMGLFPPLRRATVMELLARDKSRITWISPTNEEGFSGTRKSFRIDSVPDDSFRPLSDWIEYVLEREHQPIQSWIGAAQFDFEGFLCQEDAGKERKPARPRKKEKKIKESSPLNDESNLSPTEFPDTTPQEPETTNSSLNLAPNELVNRLREAEDSFIALRTPMDDPEVQRLWLELAQLNGALNHLGDAAICFSNALWETPCPVRRWSEMWCGVEEESASDHQIANGELLRIINTEVPVHTDLRRLSAYLIWSSSLPEAPAELTGHLNALQQYLEKHEGAMGVRVAWLVWHAIYVLSGSDVLVLARARDRLLERLFLHGLTPEFDLPGFLRFVGLQARNRFHALRDQVIRLHGLVQEWARKGMNATTETHAYIDLIFAFGLARLGESHEAHKLRDDAALILASGDEIHSWLYEAYEFRIQQALDGKAGAEPLPPRTLEQLEAMENPDYLVHLEAAALDHVKQGLKLMRFKVDRLRQQSRILEPHEKLDPYRHWHGRFADPLTRELNALTDLRDPEALRQRLRKLLTSKQKYKGVRNPEARVLSVALDLAPRLGQAFGEEVLDLVTVQISKLKDVEELAVLLEKSLFLAGHYDRKDDIQRLALRLDELLRGPEPLPYARLTALFSGSFRSFRKLGLQDWAAKLLARMEEVVKADPVLMSGVAVAVANENRKRRLILFLQLASAWYFFGADEKARKIIDEARDTLFRKELPGAHHVELACAYLAALGSAPRDFALSRLMEFFRKVEGIYDNWTTVSHYSLSRLNVVEAMILALMSDDFQLDREARQRLDDDEFLVRRRIHRDVREALTKAGM